MKYLGLFVLLSALSACTHTIKLRSSHFAVPITTTEQWKGQVSVGASSVTRVTLVDNIDSTPPLRDRVRINSDVDAEDLAFLGLLSSINLDANISVWKSVDAYYDSSVLGLRWQFLNHDKDSEAWVAALQAGVGSRRDKDSYEESNNSSSSADSDIKVYQVGASLGYQLEKIVPYVSYLHERYITSTEITNSGGTYKYADSGIHQYFSAGLVKKYQGLTYGIEYSHVLIDWDRSSFTTQDALAGRIGVTW